MLFKGQVTTESLLSLKVVKCVNSQLIGAPIVVYDKCTRQTHCSQNVITLFKSWDFLGNRPTLGKNKHCEKVLLSKSIFHKICDDDSDGNDKYDYFMMIVMIKNRKITWLWSQNLCNNHEFFSPMEHTAEIWEAIVTNEFKYVLHFWKILYSIFIQPKMSFSGSIKVSIVVDIFHPPNSTFSCTQFNLQRQWTSQKKQK